MAVRANAARAPGLSPAGAPRRAAVTTGPAARAFLAQRRRARGRGRGGRRTRFRRTRLTPPARDATPAHRSARGLKPLPGRRGRPLERAARLGRRGHLRFHLRRGRRHARPKRRAKNSFVIGRLTSLRSPLSSRARARRRAACVLHCRTHRGGATRAGLGSRTSIGHPSRVAMNRRTRVRTPARIADTAATGPCPCPLE